LRHLAEILTNNESYFLRERHQLEGLFGPGLEQLSEGRFSSHLKVLCAGCAAGEEPYSIVIMGKRLAPWLEVEVHAFDLDGVRLDLAKQATYNDSALRALDGEDRDRLFRPTPDKRWELRSHLRQGV